MSSDGKLAHLVNHVAFVLDESTSMWSLRDAVVRAMDAEVKNLAAESKGWGQETRVSIYVFSHSQRIRCLVWDMDANSPLLPSIADMYRPSGSTAMIDAILLGIDDLSEIPVKYGDHARLMYVFTDGEENASRTPDKVNALSQRLSKLSDDWLIAALVPNAQAQDEAVRWGIPRGNTMIWDATSTRGVEQAMSASRSATTTYMANRAAGVKTRSLFSTGVDAVNAQTVSSLQCLDPTTYDLLFVDADCRMDSQAPKQGLGFYQLTKTEKIQPDKKILVLEHDTDRVFGGPDARKLLGLPDMTVSVKPDANSKYTVFVQSKANNRKLLANTRVIVTKDFL